MIIGYTVPEIGHVTDVIVNFSLQTILFPFTPSNCLKNEKNTWRYHHFTQVYQKS